VTDGLDNEQSSEPYAPADVWGAPPSPDPDDGVQQRRRAIVILSVVATLVIVAGALAAVLVANSGGSSPASSSGSPAGGSVAAPSDVLTALTTVSPSIAEQVGSGLSAVSTQPISGAPHLLTAGKPTVLFVGGQFCPFCAAERWSILQALSRFGTFSGIAEIRSSEDDLPTFDFSHATFSSKYVAFTPVESEGQQHEPLQHLSGTQEAIFEKYSHGGAFPFLYFNGELAQAGAGYNPEVLAGQDQQQVAAQLNDVASPVTQSIVGEGNTLTAAVCSITANQPASVCQTSVISGLESKITGTVNG
jgi:hypothetical protein